MQQSNQWSAGKTSALVADMWEESDLRATEVTLAMMASFEFYARCSALALGGLLLFVVFSLRWPRYCRWVAAVGLPVSSALYIVFLLLSVCSRMHWQLELLGTVVFAGVAWWGLRRGLNILIWGWLAHPLWDLGLHHQVLTQQVIAQQGGCATYVLTCALFDWTLACALLLLRKRIANSL